MKLLTPGTVIDGFLVGDCLHAGGMAHIYQVRFADASRRASYLKMYGNICFETRESYINFPWSSETR